MVTIIIEPENTSVTFPKINSVLQLLNKLQKKSAGVLVIRNDELLTPDCKVFHGDQITVRDVTSRG